MVGCDVSVGGDGGSGQSVCVVCVGAVSGQSVCVVCVRDVSGQSVRGGSA